MFPNREPRDKILSYILSKSDKKLCRKCDSIKDYKDFRANSSNKDLKNNHCSECHYRATKLTQPQRTSSYRARRLGQIPPWADMGKIEKFYSLCPPGMQVDHIYPLKGLNSCGLHVHNNLQYLSAKDNQIKGNKLL